MFRNLAGNIERPTDDERFTNTLFRTSPERGTMLDIWEAKAFALASYIDDRCPRGLFCDLLEECNLRVWRNEVCQANRI